MSLTVSLYRYLLLINLFSGILHSIIVYVFDTIAQESSYRQPPRLLSEVLKSFNPGGSKKFIIWRGFGLQNKELNCFTQCLRYLALLMDGYDLLNDKNYIKDDQYRAGH